MSKHRTRKLSGERAPYEPPRKKALKALRPVQRTQHATPTKSITAWPRSAYKINEDTIVFYENMRRVAEWSAPGLDDGRYRSALERWQSEGKLPLGVYRIPGATISGPKKPAPREPKMDLQVRLADGRTVAVNNFGEASHVVHCSVNAEDIGGTEYAERRAGMIMNAAGQVVAHVSYNGRVWAGNSWTKETRELPRANGQTGYLTDAEYKACRRPR